jgi:hypothetical protein
VSPKKLIALVALVVAAVVALVFFKDALEIGGRADHCAEALEGAVKAKDHGFLEASIPSPGVREKIERAAKVELVYVRPGPEGARVGYALSRTETATKATLLQLTLIDGEGCRFLQDEEDGAFAR